MADCHSQYLLSPPYPPPVCNCVDATHINRIFLGSPDFHISPYSQPLLFVVSFSPPSYIPTYICLYLFRQLQQLREITGKPCGETEITDVSPACGAEIYGGVAVGSRRMRGWRRRKGRIRDREKDVGGRIGRREREGEKIRESLEVEARKEMSLAHCSPTPILLYCLVMQILPRRDKRRPFSPPPHPSHSMSSCAFACPSLAEHAFMNARMRLLCG